ncbi:MAG: isoaspartyl peptidase/L-asparaginase [Pirellulaceae bacterium]
MTKKWVFLSLLLLVGSLQSHLAAYQDPVAEPPRYAIVIHGGAGSSPDQFDDESNAKRRESLEKALAIGVKILDEGGTSLNAVEQVVLFLESDPQFNAGVGAVFNAAGSHELDASIMDGSNLACGAVAGVSHIKHPIELARLVMTETRHVLLAGNGAEEFGREQGVDFVEPDFFNTPKTKAAWERLQERLKQRESREPLSLVNPEPTGSYQGTVGCCALDSNGNLAAATSTGGMTNKKFGRVGDSPIVGAGTYADNATCAVSCTGTGEQYIRHAVAYDVSAKMKYTGVSVDEAVKDILDNTLNQGDGGIIAVSKTGEISMRYNTAGMASAAADSSGRFEIIWGNDGEK